MSELQICSRCVMDTTDPLIRFDEEGVCQYCHLQDGLEENYPLDGKEEDRLKAVIEEIKKAGKNKKYDCIIGVSGGTDSTYQLHLAHKYGLRPLAVHFDNGWNSDIAVGNIERAMKKLNYDLQTYVVNWEEFKDLQLSFLKASTPDSEIPTDIGIKATLFRIAAEEGIKYVMSGHSFRTEGRVPLMWSYGDGRYIEAVHKKFGKVPLKTYPKYKLWNLFYYSYIKRIKRIRFLYYMDYNKEEIKKMLTKEYGWQDYGGHHYESIYTRFYQGSILPKKFGIDKRKREYSALVRSKFMKREDALNKLQNEPPMPPELEARDREYVIRKLGITEKEFEQIMAQKPRTFLEFPNYYNIIRTFRKPIAFLYKFASPTTPLILREMSAKTFAK